MHIVDAIKALKGGLATEKEAHAATMAELEVAKAAEKLAVKLALEVEAELAAVAKELGVEYPAVDPAAPLKGK